MKISEILRTKAVTVSCELFPPKQGGSLSSTREVVREIAGLRPSFMSVTYGAGGSNSRNTLSVAEAVRENGVPALAHLTCVGQDRASLRASIEQFKESGVENILALRGDIPAGQTAPEVFPHASDLIREIREAGDFCIGGACYPEGHPESRNSADDIEGVRRKVESGCEFLTTQMFFDNSRYFDFVRRCREAGIQVPIIPGIKPLSTLRHLEVLPRTFSVSLPAELVREAQAHPHTVREVGIAWATAQARELKAAGVPAIHFYTMGRTDNIRKIAQALF